MSAPPSGGRTSAGLWPAARRPSPGAGGQPGEPAGARPPHPPRLLLAGAVAVAALGVWALGAALLAQERPIFAAFAPAATFAALGELLRGGELPRHLLPSLRRVGAGMLWALALGAPLGLLLGFSRPAERALSPLFQFLRMTSPLSWMPLAVMVLGIGDPSIVFLIAAAAVWPVLFNTASGVALLDRKLLAVARSLGASRWERTTRVALPAVLPQLLTGTRLALGLAWVVLVPAEMLGVRSGLGYAVLDARDRLAYGEVMALILVIGAVGFALDAALQALHRRLQPGAGAG